MKKYFSGKDIPFFLLSFFIPLICFILTSSHSLMFDDAGEFALVINLGSIAHPPGTPSYILAGMLWNSLAGLFGMNTIDSLTLFSSICISTSSLLLYCIFKIIAANLSVVLSRKNLLICTICAIAYATAATTWAWANTVEVYHFQVLMMAITLFGLVSYHFDRKKFQLLIAAAGIASGLGNHHLTMIFFLPFVPIFFLNNIFVPQVKADKKKKAIKNDENFLNRLIKIFSKKDFWLLVSVTFFITIFFYGWMYVRAQNDYPFMFGKPDSFSDLIYHVSGGSYSQNISSTSEQIIASRVPYFLKLTGMQLFVFLPLFFAGMIIMLGKRLYTLVMVIVLYFIFLFLYQLNNNQWSSTDAYMLLPFMLLTIPVFYGVIIYSDKIKAQYVLPLLLIVQIIYNYPLNNRKSYPVSDSLMKLLDKSAPKNSIVLIADWSLLIQYYYYRIVENFRPDLVVLNYDFKFTYYKIFPTLYPAFYNSVKPEYDNFVRLLSIEHPHQIRNTGCDLTSPPLTASFKTLLSKIEAVAKSENRNLLSDPHANFFYWQNKFYNPNRFVSGCFYSSLPGDTAANDNFLKMDFPYLKSPMLFTDPSALDKLVDFQAMLDGHISFYQTNKDSLRLSNSQAAHDKIIRLQREMKRRMSFAYKTE